MANQGWLAGDVAFITGGGSGLGRALVERFIAEGAKIVVLEHSPEKAEALLQDFGGDVAVVTGDVRSLVSNKQAVALAVERFGKLDILIGNAGIMDMPALLEDLPEDRLDAAFDEVYDELISYTDGAIADGQLSPYDTNVPGMLDYAGGLGGILTGAESRIGEILSASQRQQIEDSGFEWGEYLGVSAPWERLTPPPPPPGGS